MVNFLTLIIYTLLLSTNGITGDELKGLEDVAKGVFKSGFGENITQVTDDVAILKSAFKDLNNTELQALTEGAMTIGKAFDAETKEVGKAVSTMTKTFENLGETEALDLITTAFQRTGDMSDELLDTFNEYSPQFKALGYDAEGFTATLIAGAESGAFNFDKLADAAKEGFLKMGEGADATRDAITLMGLDADQIINGINSGGEDAQKAFMAVSSAIGTIENPTKRSEAAIAAFGTPLEDLGPQFQTFFGSVNQDLGNFEGATKKAAEALHNNFTSKLGIAWRDIEISATDAFKAAGGGKIFDVIAVKAKELVPQIKALVTSAVGFSKTIHDNWGTIVKVITPIGSAIGAVYLILGAVGVWNMAVNAMNLYRASAFATTLAQHGLNAALKANPIGFVITVIGLLVGAGVALYQNWDTVRSKTGQLWDKLGAFKGVATLVLGPIGQIIRTAVMMAENWDNTKGVWENVWNGIKLAASSAVNDIIGSVNWLIETINKIPGVNVPIIPKVDWGLAKAKPPTGVADFRRLESYAVGTNRVPYDMVAQIHRDEMIIPARQSKELRSAGIGINNINEKKEITRTVANSSNPVFNIAINATDKSVNEIINEFVPLLKLRLANM